MTHESDPRSVLDAAEQAAAAGDDAAAERLLREVLTLQEATLGPRHPDLVNTLNNLAVVCERMEKLDEAERGYRRAHAIAVASLPPRHPSVAASLTNLVDFCVARGIPLWTPPAVRPDAGATPSSLPPPSSGSSIESDVRAQPAPVTRSFNRRVAAILVLTTSAIVALLLVTAWPGSGASTPPSPEVERAPAPPSDPTTPAPPSARDPEPTAPSPSTNSRRASAGADAVRPAGPAPASAQVVVLAAQVCSALATSGSPDWQCTPAGEVSQPGAFTFYTRLLSGAGTTVEHRWYRGNRLHQTVRLRVGASQNSGYRTYSRNTVSPERAGDWRVELRASDGTVLHEEHFVVR